MQGVFVVDKNKQPLMPCHPARARELLIDREGGDTQPVQVKIDPGSRTTGLALVADFQRGLRCIWAAELAHCGQQIRDNLLKRRQLRRGRRARKTRYRQPRFDNRRRKAGWLPPSLQSRVDNIWTWVKRLNRAVPLTYLAMELVRFDTQKLQNPRN